MSTVGQDGVATTGAEDLRDTGKPSDEAADAPAGMDHVTAFQHPPHERGIFCNRTMNMRSIRAIGYDMDYTLVHYHSDLWERAAYDHLKRYFVELGWPMEGLAFDQNSVARGLIIDTELGNMVKANRFGFVKRAAHGTSALKYDEQRKVYARTIIDLHESRWVFLNTLFSLSEGCLFVQLVDLLDQKKLPGVLGYQDLYRRIKAALDATHMNGRLKAEIVADPSRFVVQEPEVALTLLDQKNAGKKLLLITNSEWAYTARMMELSFDPFLPGGMGWRDLFDVIVVGAQKPGFFTARNPLFEVVTDEGLLKPSVTGIREGTVFLGGSAAHVEQYLGVSGYEILYVGDHMFGDVHVTKDVLRWRTALILRELEDEILAVEAFREDEAHLGRLMTRKEDLESEACAIKLMLQRRRDGYAPDSTSAPPTDALGQRLERIRQELDVLDTEISPLAKAASRLLNPNWGLLMRAGNDKSHLARQMERYADIYTSRVSNLMYVTPYAFLRSPGGSMPHDLKARDSVDATTNDTPIT